MMQNKIAENKSLPIAENQKSELIFAAKKFVCPVEFTVDGRKSYFFAAPSFTADVS